MYSIISALSFIIRAYLCYITIDTVPIISNPLIQYLLTEIVSLYTILWVLSYATNGALIRKYNIQSKTIRAFFYFFIYVAYLFVMFGILKLLTFVRVIPI
mgnify:CR=1 FL=1